MELRYKLEIMHNSLPSVTIVTSKGIIYPFRNEYGELTPLSLEKYVKHFVTGMIRPLNNERFIKTID
jgi:hypothetical protein